MKRLLFYSFFLVFNPLFLSAQSACDSAIVANKEVTGPVHATGKPIIYLAIKDSAGMYFEKAHSVAWFTFVAPEDTILTFDLLPSTPGDDIDFLLFKDENGSFCNQVKAHKIKPLRSNIAKGDKSVEYKTGLSLAGKHNYEELGSNPSYSNPLKVKKGERYYLAVDNYTNASRSFVLMLHLRWIKPMVKKQETPSPNVKLNIVITDSEGHSVKTRLKIAGLTAKNILVEDTEYLSVRWTDGTNSRQKVLKGGKFLLDTSNISSYHLILQHGQRIKISCIATGYLLYQNYLKMPASAVEYNDTIAMIPIKEHQNMVLQDIQFVADQPTFMESANEPLSNLLDFMQANPQINILIKGYVNDPTQVNSNRYDQNLSEARAMAVQTYLNNNGIDLKRMEWKGFGSNDMLYPHPETMEEEQANRRVEIEIK